MSWLGPTHKLPAWPCPNCGAQLDCATGVGHTHPPVTDRSLTVCFTCSQPLIFRADGFEKISLKLYSSLRRDERRTLMILAKAAKQARAAKQNRN